MTQYSFRQIYLPYCLDRQENGEYVVLNRQYKPVGFTTGEWILYEDFPVSVPLKITEATARKLSYKESEELSRIYLYNDGCIPDRDKKSMDAYLIKLQLLTKLKMRT